MFDVSRPVLRAVVCTLLGSVVLAGCSTSDDESGATTSTSLPGTGEPTTADVVEPRVGPATTTVAPAAARVVITPSGVVVPVLSWGTEGYRVRTPCGSEAVLDRATPVGRVDVVVDPGHGGDEDGVIGPNGLKEKDLNLAVAEGVRRRLQSQGFSVVLARSGDYRVTLASRADIATAVEASALVSVHHNAVPDGPHDGPGSETYHQVDSAESRRLGGLVYEEVLAAFDEFDVDWVGDADAGAKFRVNDSGGDYYGILRRTAGVPAVLVESAFLSNPGEADLLARSDVQDAEAEAIATAVERFLDSDDPGSGFVDPRPDADAGGPGGGASGCVDPPL